ncbi:MAG: maleylacetoacetate isomerase [Arenicella sp.]
MKLYTYYRSSASYRVRLALNIKKVDYDMITIDLSKGEQLSAEFKEINKSGLVPTLELEGGQRINQSTAIIDWLDQKFPSPSLLLNYTGSERALIQQIVNIIACDIHPLNNLRVLKYLVNTISISEQEKINWYHHWIHKGLSAIESIIADAPYAAGEQVTMADVYLVPQVYNAQRFNVDMTSFPKTLAVNMACQQLDSFIECLPENQPDAK